MLFRIIWFLLLGFMWYQLIYGCWVQFCKYLEFNTLTQDTVRYASDLKLPAVTICSLNILQEPSDPRNLAIIRNLYIQRRNITELQLYPGEEYVRNFSLRQAIKESFMNDAVSECVTNVDGKGGKHCSIVEQFSGNRYCHTVSENTSLSEEDILTNGPPGMYVSLWTDQEKYFISYATAAGFRVKRPFHRELFWSRSFPILFWSISGIFVSKILGNLRVLSSNTLRWKIWRDRFSPPRVGYLESNRLMVLKY